MDRASRAGSRLRTAALLTLGALAVHQGRYLLAPAGTGDRHGYLELAGPTILLLTMAAIAVSFLATIALRRLPDAPAPEQATDRAVVFAVALLAVYLLQELGEGLLTSGDHALAHLLAGGGWLALPLSILLGGLAALAGHWLDRTELRAAVALLRRLPGRRGAAAPAPRPRREWTPGRTLRAIGLSPRAPPCAPAG